MPRYTNPFTPAFGGKPSHFFGRSEELSKLRKAMRDQNSPSRAVFVTGNRGYGYDGVSHLSVAHEGGVGVAEVSYGDVGHAV